MLKDFGQSEATNIYKELLSKNTNLNYDLMVIYFKLLSQYIPTFFYEVIIEDKINNQISSLPAEQLNAVTNLITNLKLGNNINSETDKFLPKLKPPAAIDLLQEQSKTRHFHISEKGKRTNNIILAKVSIKSKKIFFKEITDHESIQSSFYKNDEYFKSSLPLNGLPVHQDSKEIEKPSYYKIRKTGWNPIQIIKGKPSVFMTPKQYIINIINLINKNSICCSVQNLFFTVKQYLLELQE